MSWLWRSDSSPASFEKALARLSTQISAATVSLDKTRSRNRRGKALWTLYTSLAWLLSALILVLVVGPQQWSLPHYGGLVGGPALIFAVRKAITAVFGWSISRQQAHVDWLEKQREEKITGLKKATRYDSTQELLQKYGGAPPPKQEEREPKQGDRRKTMDSQPQRQVQRTGLPPPPTANIPGRSPQVHHPTPPSANSNRSQPQPPQDLVQSPVSVEEPGFAPNAFAQPQSSSGGHEHKSHWYDRILDVMLGEDENLAKNRLVLLCQNCRHVNGQAPPGVKTLDQLGRWRCQACGSWNGVQAEAAKVVQEMTASQVEPSSPTIAFTERKNTTEEAAQSLEEQEGATGHEGDDSTNKITKRVTRSAGKPEVEGL